MSETKRRFNLELVAATLLGIASLMTAYAAYRGSIVSDGVLANYSAATKTQNQANDTFAQADKLETSEQTLFLQFAVLTSQGNTEGADYIFELMHPAEQALVGAWGADERPDSPTSPFGGGYPEEAELPSALVLVQGLAFIEQSEAFVVEAQKADDRGDVFDMSTVFLAVTLFLAGVATLLHTRSIQRSVLSLSAVMLVIGTIVLLQAEFT